ncbi:MAG: sialate O-acetylesterase [Kiritimatiellae bacterium]|nr:sialate O-acetylesterase [Kiritimatiellia bacterium]
MMRNGTLYFAILSSLLSSSIVRGEVELPSLFGNNMVIQRELPVRVWGIAKPGEHVRVEIAEQKAECIADKNGNWVITLKPMQVGDPLEMTVAGKNIIIIRNILVGDVWLASGQSNMDRDSSSSNAREDVLAANYPGIRLFTVGLRPSRVPLKDVEGKWSICGPETAARFSAVAYCFGQQIHKELNVPVGLIKSARGGTHVESWVCKETVFGSDSDMKSFIEPWEKSARVWPEKKKQYETEFKRWRQACLTTPFLDEPERPFPWDPENHINYPGNLYNGMIAPLVPYGIKGVIWYQGEADAAGRAAGLYGKLLPALVKNWRTVWNQGDLSFLIVQLSAWGKKQVEPVEPSTWAVVREAQAQTLSVPATCMAVTIDINEEGNIHPKNLREIGQRLALAALGAVYKQKIVGSGPIYRSLTIEGNKVLLDFDHADGGLAIKGGENDANGFAIAGENKKFVWAKARVEGNRIVVWSEDVKDLVAVRYGWANNPIVSFYNAAGLPASPFRTDNWRF